LAEIAAIELRHVEARQWTEFHRTILPLGPAYCALGDAQKAIEFYEKHLDITQEIGDRRGKGNALWNMSLAQDSLGNQAEAAKLANEALQT
jgi:tetratricopeptide (TPR) repeat protein